MLKISALLETYHVRAAQQVRNVIQVSSNAAGFAFYFVLIIIKIIIINIHNISTQAYLVLFDNGGGNLERDFISVLSFEMLSA